MDGKYRLRVLSAWELLELRREAADRECADEREGALLANASLLARCLSTEEGRAFEDAEDVLHAMSAGEINALVGRYAAMDSTVPEERSGGENAAFDMARYRRLKEGGIT